jgi:hypothetical protein
VNEVLYMFVIPFTGTYGAVLRILLRHSKIIREQIEASFTVESHD